MRSTLKNLQSIAFGLFAVVGAIYLASILMSKNQVYLPTSLHVSRILQLPFLVTTLLNFTVQLVEPLAEDQKKHTILISLVVAANILLFIGAIYLHFTS